VIEKLGSPLAIAKSRIHPLQVLVALKTYGQGRGGRGKGEWDPCARVVDALDRAFYASFGNVEPSGKRTFLAIDVSGSMHWNNLAGMEGITPAIGAAAMALVTEATESQVHVGAFDTTIIPVAVSSRQRLDDVVETFRRIGRAGTDCAQPMLHALEKGLSVDTFVVYTDSETWYGKVHPSQALKMYRERTGIPARLVVVGMEANPFTIADPRDPGMLDVVGFDTSTPQIISAFSRGDF
jgi:60 kDa SS-A/Ro ribonucleoprotein